MATYQGIIVNDAGEVYLVDLSAGSVKQVFPGDPGYPASLSGVDLHAKIEALQSANCFVVPGTASSKGAETPPPIPIMIMIGAAKIA